MTNYKAEIKEKIFNTAEFDKNHLVRVKVAVQNFFLPGMPEYGKEVEKELAKYQ